MITPIGKAVAVAVAARLLFSFLNKIYVKSFNITEKKN